MPNFLTDPYWIVYSLAALAGILAAVIPLFLAIGSRTSKELTYKVLSNASLVDQAVKSVTIFRENGEEITDADLLVLSVKNTGNTTITSENYIEPFVLSLTDREVIDITLVETEPAAGQVSQRSAKKSSTNGILLDKPVVNKKISVVLSVLVRGPKASKEEIQRNIKVEGGLIDGEVVPYRPPQRIQGKYVVSGIGVALVVVTLIASFFHIFTPSLPSAANCASGSIAVGGSTALLPLVSKAAGKYQAMCSQAHISINQNVASSEAGLREVNVGSIQIGDSDLRSSNLGLVDHPVAVATYVLILNQAISGVTNLTSRQVQGIYNGSITRWNQAGIGGPDMAIFVVSRTSTSGTRKTFEQYVLHGPEKLPLGPNHIEVDTTDIVASTVANTSGGIGYVDVGTATRQKLQTALIDGIEALPGNVENGRYIFWTVEHMYTTGNPTGLTRAFLEYMIGDEIKGVISDLDYVPFNNVSSTTINAHPSPLAPGGL